MRVLARVFMWITILCGIVNGLMFLYVEWLFLRENFLQLLNPLLHIQVFFTLLGLPLFWISTGLALLCYFASYGAEKAAEEKEFGS